MIFWLTNPLFLALGRTRYKNALSQYNIYASESVTYFTIL